MAFFNLELYMQIIYLLLVAWVVFSSFYMHRAYYKGLNKVIPYVYDSIPTVFTTLGVLGTFIGIYFGLREFEVENITDSIPPLLEGLKTAFTTSIFGVSLSLIFGKISQVVLRYSEKKIPPKPTNELAAFQEMIELIKISNTDSNNNFKVLINSIVGDSDNSITSQFAKLKNQFTEIEKGVTKQSEILEKVNQSLGGDGETSLLTQIQKLRADGNDNFKENSKTLNSILEAVQIVYKSIGNKKDKTLLSQLQELRNEQNENAIENNKNVKWIVESMDKNNLLISEKFDEFSELLAKNNTEALVEVMKRATEEFNAQMSALIEKLVQENFKELNNSVKRMNDWQIENKEMISELTLQFMNVSENFAIASTSIKEITENTTKLTDENSHLTKLITALQKVMVDDTKYQEITGQLTSTINILKENTEAFDATTHKLNDWVRNQMNFSDSVAVLLSRLEKIEKIKDINDVFWNDTKKQLNEGVSIIERASKSLSNDLENINAEFYARLNDTLQNLDNLIQRIIQEYN